MPEIGESLREARSRGKVDLAEVEEATKIRAKYLRALENEEWGLLPGPAFVKSFLRTYADYLGLDGKLLVDEYKLRHERPSDLDQMPIAPNLGRQRPPGPVSRISPALVIGVVIVVLLGLFAYLGASSSDNNSSDSASSPSGHDKAAAAAARKRKQQQAAAARREQLRKQKVRLRIDPTGAVFVCLQRAGGKILIPGEILQAGDTTRTFSSKRFKLTLGNSAANLIVDGKSVAVPPSDSSIAYLVTRRGAKQLRTGAGPSCQGGAGTTTG
jgi:hypothetical protein